MWMLTGMRNFQFNENIIAYLFSLSSATSTNSTHNWKKYSVKVWLTILLGAYSIVKLYNLLLHLLQV